MTVNRYGVAEAWSGLSDDDRPEDVPYGSTYFRTDDGITEVYTADGWVNQASGGAVRAGGLQFQDFVLDNDQIIALPTQAVLVVPAPGEGLTIRAGCTLGLGEVVLLLDWYDDYATINATPTVVFTLAEPGAQQGPNASYGGFGNPLGNMLAWGAGGALNPQWLITPGQAINQADSMNERDYWDNQGIWISVDNGGDGNFTEGHVSNKLYGRIWYTVVPTLPSGFNV